MKAWRRDSLRSDSTQDGSRDGIDPVIHRVLPPISATTGMRSQQNLFNDPRSLSGRDAFSFDESVQPRAQ